MLYKQITIILLLDFIVMTIVRLYKQINFRGLDQSWLTHTVLWYSTYLFTKTHVESSYVANIDSTLIGSLLKLSPDPG